ncbi:MAG: thioredoxin family protein [Candidatus Sulfotelmatobacter sp.]
MLSVRPKTFARLLILIIATLTLLPQSAFAQTAAAAPTTFSPLDQWKAAILAGDASALKSFYSTNPAAEIEANGQNTTADSDISFWLSLKPRSIKIEIVRLKEHPDAEGVIFKAAVQTGLANGETMNVTDAQGWKKQGEQWHITGAERTDAPHLAQPSDMKKNIYPPEADARDEIKQAETSAAAQHRRILLVFGANWCFDCHVLDLALHRPDFAATMTGYEVVHVDTGDDGKKNNDLAQQFSVPLDKGIPALAVIDADGKLVVSQKNGEFEDARSLTPEALLEFLNKWKPQPR